jgi:hypothetical protein
MIMLSIARSRFPPYDSPLSLSLACSPARRARLFTARVYRSPVSPRVPSGEIFGVNWTQKPRIGTVTVRSPCRKTHLMRELLSRLMPRGEYVTALHGIKYVNGAKIGACVSNDERNAATFFSFAALIKISTRRLIK